MNPPGNDRSHHLKSKPSIGTRKFFLVMDGKRCPLKADTNGEREHRRSKQPQIGVVVVSILLLLPLFEFATTAPVTH
jgi:hypothetical protein